MTVKELKQYLSFVSDENMQVLITNDFKTQKNIGIVYEMQIPTKNSSKFCILVPDTYVHPKFFEEEPW